MNNFMDNLKRTLGEDFNESRTENGAVGYRTSGKALLDINFAVSSSLTISFTNTAKEAGAVFWTRIPPLKKCGRHFPITSKKTATRSA